MTLPETHGPPETHLEGYKPLTHTFNFLDKFTLKHVMTLHLALWSWVGGYFVPVIQAKLVL